MKTLTLVRHAKSSWKDTSLADIDRPLNKRGQRDAPFMAQKFKEKGILPDLIVCSPALRTRLTATEFIQVLGNVSVQYDEQVYEAYAQSLLLLIQSQANAQDSLMLIGHNPGLTNLANYFLANPIDNVPTTGIVQFSFEVSTWQLISPKTASLMFFDYPKRYFPKKTAK